MRAATAKLENFFLSVSPIAEIGYQRTYSASSLILLFFIFSGMGWIWEVILHIIEDGMIINRGVLAGPWLPIYGAGGILILLLLKKWRRQPFHLFGMIMLLCGTIEYFTSVMLEMLFGVRWWDYSDMLFQLRGRVCLEGLTIFGFGGLFIVYAAAPVSGQPDTETVHPKTQNPLYAFASSLYGRSAVFLPEPQHGIRDNHIDSYCETTICPSICPIGAAMLSSAPTSFAVALLLITTRCFPLK